MFDYILDIFEYLKDILSCDYISDMKDGSYNLAAISVLTDIDIELINPQQYQDICRYLGI